MKVCACNWAKKQAYFRSNSKPVYNGYVIGYEMSSGMCVHVLRKMSNCKVRRAVFFGATVKGPCMEDLLGSLLLTTVNQNEPKISPRGVEMPQLNAALRARWRVWIGSFYVPVFCFRQVEIDSN